MQSASVSDNIFNIMANKSQAVGLDEAEPLACSSHSIEEPVSVSKQHSAIWVLDTNVLLDWMIFDDRQALPIAAAIQAGRICLPSRPDCREEFIRVLDYPHLQRWVEPIGVASLIALYDRWHAPIAQMRSAPLPRCRDKDDQKFLELARDSGAQILVSKDKAVLKLAKRTQRGGLFEILEVNQANQRLPGV